MMNLMELMAKLSLDSSQYERGMSAAENALGKLETAFKTFVTGYAVKKFIGLAQDAVATGMAFDSAMSQVAATMGVSTDEISELRDFAQQMGSTTRFTATEAAEALNYMALAGYDAKKSMEMLPTVLNLASAGGFDLARASDMVTDAQSALGLTTEQTTVMVDQMAKTASKSNTSVEQLGDAMLTIGGTAKFMAGGTDRLQTVLGLLADNGIKGSEAGTHLRNMLLKLSSPTKDGTAALENLGVKVFDASGNMRDMQEIMLDMSQAMESLTAEQRVQAISDIFNARDLSAVNALLGTSKERWEELGGAIAEATGSAEQMSQTQLGNLSGDITIMKSAVEGLKIQFSDGITPAIRDLVQRLTRALSNPKTQKFLRDVGEALGNVITYLTNLVSRVLLPKAISLFDDGGKKIKTFAGIAAGLVLTIKSVNTVMGLMAGTVSPTGLLIKGIGLLVGLFTAADLANQAWVANMEYLNDEQKELVENIDAAAEARQSTIDSYTESAGAILAEKKATQDLWKELQTLVTEDGHVLEGNEARVDFILGELNDALELELERNGDIITSYKDIQGEIDNLIEKQAAEALMAAGKDMYTEALQKREQALQDAGLAYDNLQEATQKYKDMEAELEQAYKDQSEAYSAGDYAKATAIDQRISQLEDEKTGVEAARLEMEKFEEAYNTANDTASSYYADVQRYEEAQMLMLQGNYEEAQRLMTDDYSVALENYRQKTDLTESERKDFYDKLKKQESYVAQYRRNYEAGMAGFTEPVLNELEAQVAESRKFAEEGGINFASGYASGMDSMLDSVTSSAARMVQAAVSTVKRAQQSNSPSKVSRGLGQDYGQGYGLGFEDEYGFVGNQAEGLVDAANGVLQTTAPQGTGRFGTVGGGALSDVVGLLQSIKDRIPRDIVLDSGVIAGSVDRALGQISMRKARGNA